MWAELTVGSGESRGSDRDNGQPEAKTGSSKAACCLTAEGMSDSEGVPLSGHGPDGSSWPWHLVPYMQTAHWAIWLPGSSAQSWQRHTPCPVSVATVESMARQKLSDS